MIGTKGSLHKSLQRDTNCYISLAGIDECEILISAQQQMVLKRGADLVRKFIIDELIKSGSLKAASREWLEHCIKLSLYIVKDKKMLDRKTKLRHEQDKCPFFHPGVCLRLGVRRAEPQHYNSGTHVWKLARDRDWSPWSCCQGAASSAPCQPRQHFNDNKGRNEQDRIANVARHSPPVSDETFLWRLRLPPRLTRTQVHSKLISSPIISMYQCSCVGFTQCRLT